jgi:hypothetical protein
MAGKLSLGKLVVTGFVLLVMAAVGVSLIAFVVLASGRPAPVSTPTATAAPGPEIQISPAEGKSGEIIAVTGIGWRPGDTVAVGLADAQDSLFLLAFAEVAGDGRFSASFAIPADWGGGPRVLVMAQSAAGDEAFAVLRISGALPTATPSATATSTPEPTATLTPAPTLVPPTSTPLPTQTPVVNPTATPVPAIKDWRGEYYTNADLTGTPVLVRNDAALNFNWGSGSPEAGIPTDRFSARWTRSFAFQGGIYRFYAYSDDGVRAWIDGVLLINEWHAATGTTYVAERALSAGEHALRIEFYEDRGAARIQFWWERVGDLSQWRGEYFSNVSLAGAPTLVRNDSAIDFDWGRGAPAAGLPADGFSVRWMRVVAFEEGLYRFSAVVDDGVRVYVDDKLVIDDWRDGVPRELAGDVNLSAGNHSLRVEYYERAGEASVTMWWTKQGSYPDWRGEYWSNVKLQGGPALVRNDKAGDKSLGIDFDWKRGAPASGLPADGFSVRWTRKIDFVATTYRFHALVDDGVRVWVDGQLILDEWRDGSAREVTVDWPMVAGKRELRVEYYERSGDARIRVWWEKVSAPTYPDWKGQYWPNVKMKDGPALVRNDKAISFEWGTGAAAPGLPTDSFSAAWSREMHFEPGVYRFYAWADDGVRVSVDGDLVLDEWHDNDGRDVYTFDLTMSGKHLLMVAYYEHGGNALIKFWWKRVGDLPTPTPTPTATPTATPTPTPTATPTPTLTPTVEVRLNEVLSSPAAVDWDGNGTADERDAWIELYNAGTAAVDIGGWMLDDGLTAAVPYTIPAGTVLQPGAYAVFYRRDTGLVLEAGGQVWLLKPGGVALEGVAYGTLARDASCSRGEDGLWHVDWPPSPGKANLPPE